MTVDELRAMPKIDAHAHVMGRPGRDFRPLVELLERHGVSWINPCVFKDDAMLRDQIGIARELAAGHPRRFAWASAFSLEGFGGPRWTEGAIAAVEAAREAGAVGIKVWKNIGMTLQEAGRYVMIDDARFDPVFERIRALDLTLVAHIGEPRNCWLPIDEMTVEGDRSYFSAHPEYHGLGIPGMPGHAAHVAARDRMVARHPGLRVVGCHLASLEYDVAEVARRLDAYPNLAVDLAARVCHLQVQEREKVRRFIIEYQDRILYGTDLASGDGQRAPEDELAEADGTYLADERYFATGDIVDAPAVARGFRCRGLELPDPVLRKLYRESARRWYPLLAKGW